MAGLRKDRQYAGKEGTGGKCENYGAPRYHGGTFPGSDLQYATPPAKASSLGPERSDATDQAAALAALHSVAADYGVGLTPHQAVIHQAIAAAETVNQRM